MDEKESSHFQTLFHLVHDLVFTESLLVNVHANGDWYAKTPLGWVNLETSSTWFKSLAAAQAALDAAQFPDGSETS